MAKLQHIAIAVQDPDEAARFFTDVMEMTVTRASDGPLAKSVFLTDGSIEIALIRFKSQDLVGKEFPVGYQGLHHIGFEVDDLEAAKQRMAQTQFSPRHDIHEARDALLQAGGGKPNPNLGVEYKYFGPGGITFDLSQKGWLKK